MGERSFEKNEQEAWQNGRAEVGTVHHRQTKLCTQVVLMLESGGGRISEEIMNTNFFDENLRKVNKSTHTIEEYEGVISSLYQNCTFN